MTTPDADERKIPSREELMKDLERLREVSSRNEKLTKELASAAGETLEKIRKEIDECVNEQSKLVDKFIDLSDDKEAIARFRGIVKEIEAWTNKLDKTSVEKEVEELRLKILNGVEEWINCLESIISGVIAKTS